MGSRQVVAGVLLAVLAAGAAAQGTGNSYPSHPVKIVVTLAPGASADTIARLYAQKLQDELKQSFLVENRAGGNQIPGTNYVAKAPADGYTLLLGNTALLTIIQSVYPKLPFDPEHDFVPAALLVISPTVLLVRPSLPAHNVKELIALAKAQPGKLNYGTPGNGTPFHLSTELFKTRTGTDMVHVPYKGTAPALTELLSGRIDLMFSNALEVLPHIQSGKLRALAVTSRTRMALLPDVPTLAESGIADAEAYSFFALVAPRGTPVEVVNRLHAAIARAQALPEVKQRLTEFAMEPGTMSREEFEAFLRDETGKWAKVARAAGVRADD